MKDDEYIVQMKVKAAGDGVNDIRFKTNKGRTIDW